MKRKLLLALLVIFIAIQFFRPEKNIHDVDATKTVVALFNTPEPVNKILQKACLDCHSENTKYPWYNNFQPVSWFMSKHVNDGKRHLNFDIFATYSPAKQLHKLEEVVEVIEKGEMPLSSYTIIHSDAKLNAEEQKQLTDWAKANMDTLRATYPADSLIFKRPSR